MSERSKLFGVTFSFHILTSSNVDSSSQAHPSGAIPSPRWANR
jgi:hypothetical protein